MRRLLAVLLFAVIALSVAAPAQSAPAADRPFVVEYYYKTKWGHAEEFLKLFKKNHYPVLKKEAEMGRIVKVWMDVGSSRVDLQACKLEYSIVSPK